MFLELEHWVLCSPNKSGVTDVTSKCVVILCGESKVSIVLVSERHSPNRKGKDMADKKYELPELIDVYRPIGELVIASVNGDKEDSPTFPGISKEMTAFLKNLKDQIDMIIRVHDKACSAKGQDELRLHQVRGRKAGEKKVKVKVSSLDDLFKS